jgi:hypothetical protein
MSLLILLEPRHHAKQNLERYVSETEFHRAPMARLYSTLATGRRGRVLTARLGARPKEGRGKGEANHVTCPQ